MPRRQIQLTSTLGKATAPHPYVIPHPSFGIRAGGLELLGELVFKDKPQILRFRHRR